jgi:NAD(P)-dependent dehydrogenase (short-subunit alcohol dehydrogenase family)
MRLENRVAVVTGGSSGIGKSIGEELAAEGAQVVLASVEPELGRTVASELTSHGANAIFVECDVTDDEAVRQLFATTVEEYGRLDILVNNAGVNYSAPFTETTPERWDATIAIDLRGAYLCCYHAVPHMAETAGGVIVNVSSVHGMTAVAGCSPYDTAKAGLFGLTRTLAVELAPKNIRVNAISPGLIDTRLWDRNLEVAESAEAHTEFWMKQIPLARIGTPKEVARAAVFLACDDSSYVTGSNLVVDGGLTTRLIPRQ